MTATAELNRWIRFAPSQRRVANLCETSVPMKVLFNAPFALSVAKGLTQLTPNQTLRYSQGERDLSRSIRMTATAELNRWIRFTPGQRSVATVCETGVPLEVLSNAPFALSAAKGLTHLTPNQTLRYAQGERDLSRSIA